MNNETVSSNNDIDVAAINAAFPKKVASAERITALEVLQFFAERNGVSISKKGKRYIASSGKWNTSDLNVNSIRKAMTFVSAAIDCKEMMAKEQLQSK